MNEHAIQIELQHTKTKAIMTTWVRKNAKLKVGCIVSIFKSDKSYDNWKVLKIYSSANLKNVETNSTDYKQTRKFSDI